MDKKRVYSIFLMLILAFFSFLMLRITVAYIPFQTDIGFLRIKQQYIHITYWKVAFFIHVYTSMPVLLAGFTQFWPWFLRHNRKAHRLIGKTYVIIILAITGPAGFIMSWHANGGWTSRLAFALLAISWWGSTYMAWKKVKEKDFTAHRHWMMRSYALTLSALTLRAWKWIMMVLLEMRPMTTYQIVAWLGFIPNLILVEYLIQREVKRSKIKAYITKE